MSHIFISYSHKDLAFVQHLASDLSASGHNLWYFHASVSPTDHPDKAIDVGLRNAAALVVIVTPDSMNSANVRDELSFALHNNLRIIAVLLRPAITFSSLERVEQIDFTISNLYASSVHKLSMLLDQQHALFSQNLLTGQSIPGSSVLSGAQVDVAVGEVNIPNDTRNFSPTFRRQYLRSLALIAAPFCDSSGENAPHYFINPNLEWYRLSNSITDVSRLAIQQESAPLYLKRLFPPTAEHLAETLDDKTSDAYQILHFIGYVEDNLFYLEDEWGYEATLSLSDLSTILQSSAVQLLIINSTPSNDTLHHLLAETPLEAIISLKSFLSRDALTWFNRYFYSALLDGQSIKNAFQTAINALNTFTPESAESFQLLFKIGFDDVQLDLPSEEQRASRSLLDASLPPLQNLPFHLDFVGQRRSLNELSREIASTAFRQIAIYGAHGSGKSYLAAEYAARFAWRYPDGILWVKTSAVTKSEDIIGQILALLQLPPATNWATLREMLHERSILIVLDQAGEWSDPVEIGELADFVARLNRIGGTRILLTAWGPVQPLTYTAGTEQNYINPLSPDEVSHLVYQTIYAQDLASEFADKDAVNALISETQGLPWLSREAVRLARLDGLDTATQDLAELEEDDVVLFDEYLQAQFKQSPPEGRALLRQLQALPAGFDYSLASTLSDQPLHALLHDLQSRHLIRRVGRRYIIPAPIRRYLRYYLPLSEDEQDAIDTRVIQQMLSQHARINE